MKDYFIINVDLHLKLYSKVKYHQPLYRNYYSLNIKHQNLYSNSCNMEVSQISITVDRDECTPSFESERDKASQFAQLITSIRLDQV